MRLFFALPLPPAIRRALSDLKEAELGKLRWVPEAQLHLTLRFVGEVDEATAEALVAAVDPSDWPALELRVHGVGVFGPPRRPRVLWAAVTPLEPLARVARSLEEAARAAGLPAETRPFAAHVTLGRFKQARPDAVAQFLRHHAGFETPPFRPPEVILYQSRLGSEGAVHEPTRRWPLPG